MEFRLSVFAARVFICWASPPAHKILNVWKKAPHVVYTSSTTKARSAHFSGLFLSGIFLVLCFKVDQDPWCPWCFTLGHPKYLYPCHKNSGKVICFNSLSFHRQTSECLSQPPSQGEKKAVCPLAETCPVPPPLQCTVLLWWLLHFSQAWEMFWPYLHKWKIKSIKINLTCPCYPIFPEPNLGSLTILQAQLLSKVEIMEAKN